MFFLLNSEYDIWDFLLLNDDSIEYIPSDHIAESLPITKNKPCIFPRELIQFLDMIGERSL